MPRLCLAKTVQQDAVLCMHSVLCLLKDLALRALNHTVSRLSAPLRRQTVQEQRILACCSHQLLVHLHRQLTLRQACTDPGRGLLDALCDSSLVSPKRTRA